MLDVRPAAEDHSGHIAGARSIPHDRLSEYLDELPDDVEIVASCRGPFCVFADDAVRRVAGRLPRLLFQHGRRTRRLRDGYPKGRRQRLPVEVPTGNEAASS